VFWTGPVHEGGEGEAEEVSAPFLRACCGDGNLALLPRFDVYRKNNRVSHCLAVCFSSSSHAASELLIYEILFWARFALLGFVWPSNLFLEEPLFRGFIQSVYGQTIGVWCSVILQAVIFALVHPSSSVSWFVSIIVAVNDCDVA
jgi:membrane protease YdiL (CAAX protease family)